MQLELCGNRLKKTYKMEMGMSGDQDERSKQDSSAEILLDAWKLMDPLQYIAKK